jgi:hypothetical protein
MKYQTKLAIITALMLSYDTAEAMQEFIGNNGDVRSYEEHDLAVLLDTPNGLLVAKPGEYVVKSEDGGFSVYSEHDFINRFESSSEAVDTGAVLAEALAQVKAAEERADKAEKLADALKKQLDAKAAAVVKPA